MENQLFKFENLLSDEEASMPPVFEPIKLEYWHNKISELESRKKEIKFPVYMKQMRSLRNRLKRQFKREQNNYNKRKRHFDIYYPLMDYEKISEAFDRCKKNVRWKRSYQMFNIRLVREIGVIHVMMKLVKLLTLPHDHFKVNERGKIRDISAPEIRERLIQSILCTEIIHPLVDHTVIKDNYACQKGKGVGFARKRIKKFLVDLWKENKGNASALQADLSKYFDSIPHTNIMDLWRRFITNPYTLSMIEQIIKKKLTEDGEPADTGLCLGSELSQITAVLYPSKIDHSSKEFFKLKKYGRYNDDMVAIHKNKRFLDRYLKWLTTELANIGLKLNEKKTKIVNIKKQGLKILKVHYIYDRRKNNGKVVMLSGRESAKRERRKLRKFVKNLKARKMTLKEIIDCYKGWRKNILKSFNAYNLVCKMDEYFKKIFNIKYIRFKDWEKNIVMMPDGKPPAITNKAA